MSGLLHGARFEVVHNAAPSKKADLHGAANSSLLGSSNFRACVYKEAFLHGCSLGSMR